MKIGRFGALGHEVPVAVQDQVAYDLRRITADIDPPFFERGGFSLVKDAIGAGLLDEYREPIAAEPVRVGAPIARPAAIVCVGMNYAAHAAESGATPPSELVLFYKHPNTLVGPNDAIRLPPGSTHTDWEVELAVEGLGSQKQLVGGA